MTQKTQIREGREWNEKTFNSFSPLFWFDLRFLRHLRLYSLRI